MALRYLGSSARAACVCEKSAPPFSIFAKKCSASAGRVPSATNRLWGCLPAAVFSADTIRSAVVGGHCEPSSANTKTGANPCAAAGIAPDATDASAGFPVFDSGLLRRVPRTFHRRLSSSLSPMKATTCSKAIRACSKDEATITVSPLGTASGPSSVAAGDPRK